MLTPCFIFQTMIYARRLQTFQAWMVLMVTIATAFDIDVNLPNIQLEALKGK
jgi:hypothetical protein